MAHSLILGTTESGKTTLAKRLSQQFKAAQIGVLVLDPLCDPGWNADYQTSNPDEFLAVFWKSRCCAVFIDEASTSVGRYDEAMHGTATRGRHFGHSCHYLSQRGVQIAPTVRDQCSNLFLFTTALKDSQVHANEWNDDTILTAPQLKRGEYFHVTRYEKAVRYSLFGSPSRRTDRSAKGENGVAKERVLQSNVDDSKRPEESP